MQHDRIDRAHLQDMLTFAEEVVNLFMPGIERDTYLSDVQIRRSVERSIELIGEAARHVSDGFRAAHPEIPWKKIVAQRNVLLHEYGRVDDGLIWNLTRNELPALVEQLRAILANL